MKIYFCGSIKGGRQLADRYARFISHMKSYGDVLTEHIGNADYGKGGYKPAEEVYRQDTAWLTESDGVVAEVTVPSLGVGYELAFAEKLRKPCLVIYDSELNNNISSMITGDDYFRCRCYKGETQAIQTIDEFLTEFTEDK